MGVSISLKSHHAVIFDLDGVITKTATLHAKAWKMMFDEFLEKRAKEKGKPFIPFDAETDYLQFVDGKPRYEGIQSFFESRQISLPMGLASDDENTETVMGLGAKKNGMFVRLLESEGVDVYPSTIKLIKALRKVGIKTALISSSKNCASIIQKLKAGHLFDTKIDGLDSERLKIKGKPSPDVFLEAAKRLGVEPKHVVIVEDAISGVQSGRDGNFGLVIGVDRANQSEELLANGAHVVVKGLSEVFLEEDCTLQSNALEQFSQLQEKFQNREVAIFLDYDGTLTPIVSHPDLAIMGDSMREILQQLAEKVIVAVVSGRDRPDVEKHVQLPSIFYAGSHGFDISGPKNQNFEVEEGKEKLSALEEVEVALKKNISAIKGAWVERKKYSVAVHYRQVKEEDEDKVEELISGIHRVFRDDLRVATGKKIFEFQPAIPWHKGKALKWLIKLFKLNREDVVPIYIGDDVTDEDAFKALIDNGIGIAVQEEAKPTAACYTLKDPQEVEQFLSKLNEWIPCKTHTIGR